MTLESDSLFQQGLEIARAAGDHFAEKMALMHLGLAYSAMRNLAQAFALFDQALAIARQVRDQQHEADLLWQLAIVHAEGNQRDQAVVRAQAAIELFKQMGNPQVDWLENQLEKYRAGKVGTSLTGVGSAQVSSSSFFGGQIVAGGWTDQGIVPGQSQGTSGPGLLRMAFSAMKSMVQFAGSGFKPRAAGTYQKRLLTCKSCEHHTGTTLVNADKHLSTAAYMQVMRTPYRAGPVAPPPLRQSAAYMQVMRTPYRSGVGSRKC